MMTDDRFKPDIITLRRKADGDAVCNLPIIVQHHSPTGINWGYRGSGPADLALLILEHYFRQSQYIGSVMECFSGFCFHAAWTHHQAFKQEIVAHIPPEGTTLFWPEIEAWVEAQDTEKERRFLFDVIAPESSFYDRLLDITRQPAPGLIDLGEEGAIVPGIKSVQWFDHGQRCRLIFETPSDILGDFADEDE